MSDTLQKRGKRTKHGLLDTPQSHCSPVRHLDIARSSWTRSLTSPSYAEDPGLIDRHISNCTPMTFVARVPPT